MYYIGWVEFLFIPSSYSEGPWGIQGGPLLSVRKSPQGVGESSWGVQGVPLSSVRQCSSVRKGVYMVTTSSQRVRQGPRSQKKSGIHTTAEVRPWPSGSEVTLFSSPQQVYLQSPHRSINSLYRVLINSSACPTCHSPMSLG